MHKKKYEGLIEVLYCKEDRIRRHGVSIPWNFHIVKLSDGREAKYVGRHLMIGMKFYTMECLIEEHPQYGLQLKRLNIKEQHISKPENLAVNNQQKK